MVRKPKEPAREIDPHVLKWLASTAEVKAEFDKQNGGGASGVQAAREEYCKEVKLISSLLDDHTFTGEKLLEWESWVEKASPHTFPNEVPYAASSLLLLKAYLESKVKPIFAVIDDEADGTEAAGGSVVERGLQSRTARGLTGIMSLILRRLEPDEDSPADSTPYLSVAWTEVLLELLDCIGCATSEAATAGAKLAKAMLFISQESHVVGQDVWPKTVRTLAMRKRLGMIVMRTKASPISLQAMRTLMWSLDTTPGTPKHLTMLLFSLLQQHPSLKHASKELFSPLVRLLGSPPLRPTKRHRAYMHIFNFLSELDDRDRAKGFPIQNLVMRQGGTKFVCDKYGMPEGNVIVYTDAYSIHVNELLKSGDEDPFMIPYQRIRTCTRSDDPMRHRFTFIVEPVKKRDHAGDEVEDLTTQVILEVEEKYSDKFEAALRKRIDPSKCTLANGHTLPSESTGTTGLTTSAKAQTTADAEQSELVPDSSHDRQVASEHAGGQEDRAQGTAGTTEHPSLDNSHISDSLPLDDNHRAPPAVAGQDLAADDEEEAAAPVVASKGKPRSAKGKKASEFPQVDSPPPNRHHEAAPDDEPALADVKVSARPRSRKGQAVAGAEAKYPKAKKKGTPLDEPDSLQSNTTRPTRNAKTRSKAKTADMLGCEAAPLDDQDDEAAEQGSGRAGRDELNPAREDLGATMSTADRAVVERVVDQPIPPAASAKSKGAVKGKGKAAVVTSSASPVKRRAGLSRPPISKLNKGVETDLDPSRDVHADAHDEQEDDASPSPSLPKTRPVSKRVAAAAMKAAPRKTDRVYIEDSQGKINESLGASGPIEETFKDDAEAGGEPNEEDMTDDEDPALKPKTRAKAVPAKKADEDAETISEPALPAVSQHVPVTKPNTITGSKYRYKRGKSKAATLMDHYSDEEDEPDVGDDNAGDSHDPAGDDVDDTPTPAKYSKGKGKAATTKATIALPVRTRTQRTTIAAEIEAGRAMTPAAVLEAKAKEGESRVTKGKAAAEAKKRGGRPKVELKAKAATAPAAFEVDEASEAVASDDWGKRESTAHKPLGEAASSSKRDETMALSDEGDGGAGLLLVEMEPRKSNKTTKSAASRPGRAKPVPTADVQSLSTVPAKEKVSAGESEAAESGSTTRKAEDATKGTVHHDAHPRPVDRVEGISVRSKGKEAQAPVTQNERRLAQPETLQLGDTQGRDGRDGMKSGGGVRDRRQEAGGRGVRTKDATKEPQDQAGPPITTSLGQPAAVPAKPSPVGPPPSPLGADTAQPSPAPAKRPIIPASSEVSSASPIPLRHIRALKRAKTTGTMRVPRSVTFSDPLQPDEVEQTSNLVDRAAPLVPAKASGGGQPDPTRGDRGKVRDTADKQASPPTEYARGEPFLPTPIKRKIDDLGRYGADQAIERSRRQAALLALCSPIVAFPPRYPSPATNPTSSANPEWTAMNEQRVSPRSVQAAIISEPAVRSDTRESRKRKVSIREPENSPVTAKHRKAQDGHRGNERRTAAEIIMKTIDDIAESVKTRLTSRLALPDKTAAAVRLYISRTACKLVDGFTTDHTATFHALSQQASTLHQDRALLQVAYNTQIELSKAHHRKVREALKKRKNAMDGMPAVLFP